MTRARAVLGPTTTNVVLLILGAALLLLTRQLVREFTHFTIGYSGVAGWSLLVYLAAVAVILTRPVNRYTFGVILAIGILCRLVPLLDRPVMSSDVYRYAWDGVVQHAGISPYRYVPGDPALSFLRAPNQDLFDRINRRDYAHTIYPPGAQFLFYLITWINPSVTFMKVAMVLFEGLTVYALLQCLCLTGTPRERILLYAWCPLLIWEIGSSGHIDSAVMAFICLAILARLRKQDGITGLFLAAAVLIKFYPVVLLPAFFRRKHWRMVWAFSGLIAFSYLCYAHVGWRVFGFMGGYLNEEGVESGTRFFLLQAVQRVFGLQELPVAGFLVFAAIVLGSLAFWCWRTSSLSDTDPRSLAQPGHEFLPQATSLAFALMLLFSPHYPWYVAWLIPFLVLLPNWPVLAYVSGLFYLCTTWRFGAGTVEAQYAMNRVLYGLVIVAAVVELVIRRWAVRRSIIHVTEEESTRTQRLETQRQS